jgi:protein involved in polysaccharide export with SLBB domain
MQDFRSTTALRVASRVITWWVVLGMVQPSAFAQTIEGRGGDEQLTRTPQVVQTQGALADPLEGPVDPATYVLGPSDQLLMILKGPETALHYLRVFPEGNVILPNYGAFQASGLTLAEFTKQVRVVLQAYYRNVDVDIQLSVPRRFLIYVLGEVGKPGPATATAMSRVSDIIAQAGGSGSQRLIEIREGGKVMRTVDLFMFMHTGNFDHNPTLKEGQMIVVPRREKAVTVIGEVRKAGTYEMLSGETMVDLLGYCGGIGPLGNPDVILRERIENARALPLYIFSVENADTVGLLDMDVIVVGNITSYDGHAPVQVQGGGGRNGVFLVTRPEPLHDFLRRLWLIDPAAFDIEQAVLEHPLGNSTASEQTEFSVRDVLAGGSDLVVQPGDFIVIPPTIANVYVAGEVNTPGPVPFRPGLTAEQYVTLAGGPNNNGSYGKLKIVSFEGEEREANRNSAIYRGDSIIVGVRTSKIFGALWIGLLSVTSLAVALAALANSLD